MLSSMSIATRTVLVLTLALGAFVVVNFIPHAWATACAGQQLLNTNELADCGTTDNLWMANANMLINVQVTNNGMKDDCAVTIYFAQQGQPGKAITPTVAAGKTRGGATNVAPGDIVFYTCTKQDKGTCNFHVEINSIP